MTLSTRPDGRHTINPCDPARFNDGIGVFLGIFSVGENPSSKKVFFRFFSNFFDQLGKNFL